MLGKYAYHAVPVNSDRRASDLESGVRSWRPNQEHQTFSVINDARQMLSMVINKLPLMAKSL